jgi:23S rRNA U2552 (ribose-2'-O)-methylase RlmE/FtsJ
MSEYNSDFYKKMADGAELSASIILSDLFKLITPEKVIDLGCGLGCWLGVAKKLGATSVTGFDGDYVNRRQLYIEPSEFTSIDLLNCMPNSIKADLALCMEVAEHLPSSRADDIVEFLCASSDVVLFGAAIPGQGGAHHINEKWQSYWVEKFAKNNFVHSVIIRDKFWNNKHVAVWYRQNSLIFINKSRSDLIEKFNSQLIQNIVDVVHPDLYAMKMKRYNIQEKILTILQRHLNTARSVINSFKS